MWVRSGFLRQVSESVSWEIFKSRRGSQVNILSNSTQVHNERNQKALWIPFPVPWHGSQCVLDLEGAIIQPLNCTDHNMLMAALPHGCCPQKLTQHNAKSQGFRIGRAGVTFQLGLWPLGESFSSLASVLSSLKWDRWTRWCFCPSESERLWF